MRGDAHQPRQHRQARHRRHLCRQRRARSGSSRPTSCCSARSSCSTSSCCCCPASARPTTPRTGQGADRPQLLLPGRHRASIGFFDGQDTSTRSSPPARSACASTSSTATISTTASSASSAAAIWARCRPTAGRSRPRRCRPARPLWGAGWKKARRATTTYSTMFAGAGCTAAATAIAATTSISTRPTPIASAARCCGMTIDFHDNELKMSAYLTDRYAEIIQQMGPKQMVKQPRKGPYDITVYQTTHTCGGAIMGDRRRQTARSTATCRAGTCRTCSSPAPPPSRRTPATTRPARSAPWPIWAAEAIRAQYLKNPGPLVHA